MWRKSVGDPAVTYASYLKIDELLALQEPRSPEPEHDELLFIIVHQVESRRTHPGVALPPCEDGRADDRNQARDRRLRRRGLPAGSSRAALVSRPLGNPVAAVSITVPAVVVGPASSQTTRRPRSGSDREITSVQASECSIGPTHPSGWAACRATSRNAPGRRRGWHGAHAGALVPSDVLRMPLRRCASRCADGCHPRWQRHASQRKALTGSTRAARRAGR